MGKRGPAPRPTSLRIVYGDQPNRINYKEPKAPLADPADIPEHLSEEAREVWNRLAPQLAEKGLLTTWDQDTFLVFCDAVVAHRKAVKLVGQSLLVKGLHGGLVKNPAHQLVRDNA